MWTVLSQDTNLLLFKSTDLLQEGGDLPAGKSVCSIPQRL